MNGFDVFFADPWWLVLIKAVFALVFLLMSPTSTLVLPTRAETSAGQAPAMV